MARGTFVVSAEGITTIKPLRPSNQNVDQAASGLRPGVIEQIAHWWKQSLDEAALSGKVLDSADLSEVAEKFQCSEEEAVRGLGVGEHLYWGGGQ